MTDFFRPLLELTVILPGMLLAYFPVKPYLKQPPLKLAAWMAPLLAALSVLGSAFCFWKQLPTRPVLFLFLPVLFFLYHKTLRISIWKSGSVFLAICAVFACTNSFSRAMNAVLIQHLHLAETSPWFCTQAGIFYNLVCLLFALAAWHPASHAARTLVMDENFAQTWYIFWILPLIFIGLNLFMVPKYSNTLYTGRVLQGYFVISLVLLLILLLFYTMFLLMAQSLNKNARLQQENHFLSLQQTRYANLRAAIEEARQARHDIRHHFLQLSALADQEDLKGIKDYLSRASSRLPALDLHVCENHAVDSVIGYYSALAERESIPFHVKADLPAQLPIDEIDVCLVLSNLLENAMEASLKTSRSRRKINVEIYLHYSRLLLLQVENTFDGTILEKNQIFQSSKRPGSGIGIQSIRHIAEKNSGASSFTHENGIFSAKVMLRL